MKRRNKNNHKLRRSYLRHMIPAVVWLSAVASVVLLFRQRSERFEIVGIARGEVRQVAASSTGRITDISVELFQPVRAGQTLAVVNTILDNEQRIETELTAQLNTAAAEAERLMALLIPTQGQSEMNGARLQISREDNYRRLIGDAQSTSVR